MNPKIFPHILTYYDKEVIKLIMEKYGLDQWEALRRFIKSETRAPEQPASDGIFIICMSFTTAKPRKMPLPISTASYPRQEALSPPSITQYRKKECC